MRELMSKEFSKLKSLKTGQHIDGPPFVALLVNDKPGLQVVADSGGWINAPVTCRTSEGEYCVPVIPGSVIVNSGGTLMHLSKGRIGATLHRVNPMLIPEGETRVSLPYFLLPRMDGPLVPFGERKTNGTSNGTEVTGYNTNRDRGTNAAVNRMGTFPQVTRKWWRKEFEELSAKHRAEVEAETQSAFDLAQKRAQENQQSKL
jgi:isopenicillin N synthase-like dioxygenase